MSIELHPSELAYAFSYAKIDSIIGWGREPFLPAGPQDGDPEGWYSNGEARLVAAGRLVGAPQTRLNFTDEMTQAVLALVNPAIVLMAQRKTGDGVRTLTVHAKGQDFVGLTRQTDGNFDLSRYADLTAAAAASAAFVGASLSPLTAEARIEADNDTFPDLNQLARAGKADAVAVALAGLGAAEPDARSAAQAIADPTAAGVVSVLYCGNNIVQDAETFSVMTNTADDTWILFAAASLEGPVILERSSVAALTARVAVGVAARLAVTA